MNRQITSNKEYEIAINNKKNFEELFNSYVEELRVFSKSDQLIGNNKTTYIENFAKFRDFKVDTVKKQGIFYIKDMNQMILPDYLDLLPKFGVISSANNKPIFNERFVMPIYNSNRDVQGLVGYNAYANERYIYSTSEYYRRRETLYGLENWNIACEKGYAVITEGITDTIRLRDLGIQNSFAMCGTHKSEFILKQLNRLKYGVVLIPDRDNAGLQAHSRWKLNRTLTLFIALPYKDLDEMCRNNEENKEWLKDYMRDIEVWMKQMEHKGKECLSEKVTMI